MIDSELAALAPIWYVVFLLSITCHEAAHAWAAELGGDPTAALAGQVSLNPIPHVRREPFGTILVPMLSLIFAGWMIGWASAPFNPYWQQRHPGASPSKIRACSIIITDPKAASPAPRRV